MKSKEATTVRNEGLSRYQARVVAQKTESTIKAAQAAFEQHGYHDVRMVDVARDADVSTATLYKHFRSKENLLAAVLEQDDCEAQDKKVKQAPGVIILQNMLVAEMQQVRTILEEQDCAKSTLKMVDEVLDGLRRQSA